MKIRIALSAIVACLLAVGAFGTARADVVFGNLGSLGNNALSNTNFGVQDTSWLGQGFTVGGTNTSVTSVTLGLFDANGTTVNLSIYAGGTAGPSGSPLGTSSQTVGSTTPALQTFNFSPNVNLNSGSGYWIVASTTEPGGLFNWAFNDAGDFGTVQNASGWTAIANQTRNSTDGGLTWSNSGVNRPTAFSINAVVPVPEPSTWALAAAGLAAAGFVRARRRKARD